MPIVAYPNFAHIAHQFQSHTDASASGLWAILEQCGRVIVYTSSTSTTAERNYSILQRECLAIIVTLKQFCHYLLGRRFAFLQIMHHYSGLQIRKWKDYLLTGPFPHRKLTLVLLTGRVL